ncbi:MAG: hypothetical protein NT071_11100 [Burkholderiales bacterium]|nr:hypothetical protein [Burkholderiales bacterium]
MKQLLEPTNLYGPGANYDPHTVTIWGSGLASPSGLRLRLN